jgi:hypothetical protein
MSRHRTDKEVYDTDREDVKSIRIHHQANTEPATLPQFTTR